MNKIWKHSNGQIVISPDRPDNNYTDETNIANWIGMMKKKNMTLENVKQHVESYITEKNNQLSDYDTKWLEIYQSLPQ